MALLPKQALCEEIGALSGIFATGLLSMLCFAFSTGVGFGGLVERLAKRHFIHLFRVFENLHLVDF